MTGSPAMGVVPRFAQPLRWVAGLRTRHLNAAIAASSCRAVAECPPGLHRHQPLSLCAGSSRLAGPRRMHGATP